MNTIKCVKTNLGIYFSIEGALRNAKYKVNGLEPVETFNQGWYALPDVQVISELERFVEGKFVNPRYELVDPAMVSDKVPLTLSMEDICLDDDYEWSKYTNLRSLYVREYDKEDDRWEACDFEVVVAAEVTIDDMGKPSDMKIKRAKSEDYPHKGVREDFLRDIVSYTQLEQCLTPEVLRHKRPCSLTSKQTYEIVRLYINENIDPKICYVSSNYRFCFTVQKKVKIKEWKKPILKENGRPYATPRVKSITTKNVDIFEMTHTGENYRGYTPIKGFSGDCLEDLASNIKDYLSELIEYINQPVTECSNCNGCGHIFGNTFPMNERAA